PYVLWKTTPPKTAARINKTVADPAVTAYADPYFIDIGAYPFADIGDLVHKGYLCRQHCISRIFSHLGASDVHCNQPLMVLGKRPVKFFYLLKGVSIIRAYHDPVRPHEVLNCRAFL